MSQKTHTWGRSNHVPAPHPSCRELIVNDTEDFTAATCDACGTNVRARGVISLPSGRVLTYCYHHLNKHRNAAEAMGALVVTLVTV